jgi:hypothetical protein
MAAKVPDGYTDAAGTAASGSTYALKSPFQNIWRTNTSGTITNAGSGLNGAKAMLFGFSDIDTGDVWTSGIQNILGVFCQVDGAGQAVTAYVSNRATGAITFFSSAANSAGQVLVLVGHS